MTETPQQTTRSDAATEATRLRDTAHRPTWNSYALGDEIVTGALTVTETHVVQWASLTGDWVPLHVDEEYAAQTQFGGRIAHGPLTYSLALGLMTQTHAYDHVVAWLGTDKLRALAPVLPGDTIRAVARIVEHRLTKRADRGVVTFAFTVTNQRGETVMTFENAVLMPCEPQVDGAA